MDTYTGLRGTKNKRNTPYLATLLIICAILALMFFRNPISGVLWKLASPVIGARNATTDTLHTWAAVLKSKEALQSENDQLRAALASTTIQLIDRNTLYAENVMLKNRFDLKQDGVFAGIIAQPPRVPYDELIIDAGNRNGIILGDLVLAEGTVVVGTVSHVYDTTSRVTLFSSPGATYDALIVTTDGKSVPVSMEGQGAGSLRGVLPSGSNVHAGDTIHFPGIFGGFVGTVSGISRSGDGVFTEVYAHLPVDPFSLRFVHVVHGIQP